MGLYFLTPGAVTRPAAVLYDRARSAFALAAPSAIDWPRALARRELAACVRNRVRARRAAPRRRTSAPPKRRPRSASRVSFDGNYREQLWAEHRRRRAAILRRMLATARLAFVDDRDVALILGTRVRASRRARAPPRGRGRGVRAFPRLERICSTIRDADERARHELSAVMFTRTQRARVAHARRSTASSTASARATRSRPASCTGSPRGRDEQSTLEFAAAAAALKHSVRGDFNVVEARRRRAAPRRRVARRSPLTSARAL